MPAWVRQIFSPGKVEIARKKGPAAEIGPVSPAGWRHHTEATPK
jgi:hypothetical protein